MIGQRTAVLLCLCCCTGMEAVMRRGASALSRLTMSSSDYTAVMIIPTGIAASIGGYAGDGLPSARLIASVVDTLITHPNVVNGAMLYWPIENLLYVEGYSLDEFARGTLALRPTLKKANKIGLLLDKGIEESLVLRHLQVAEGMRATVGIDVHHCMISSEPVGVQTRVSEESGASWGSIENTDTLVQGAQALIDKGCDAVAVIARFPEDEGEEDLERFSLYRQGKGVDAIAGVEALISHVIAKRLMIPVAHAPAFMPTEVDAQVSPKAAAEELGYTFLPCVLANLHRAPSLISLTPLTPPIEGTITACDVDVCIVPINAMGGPAVLSFLARETLVICVEENETAMLVDEEGLRGSFNGKVIIARSYFEAAGMIAAHKAGILFSAVSRLGGDECTLPITKL